MTSVLYSSDEQNGSPPCHSDWSINAFVRIWETSSQPICTLQEMQVEAFGHFCSDAIYKICGVI